MDRKPVTVREASTQWKERASGAVLLPLVDGEVSPPALHAAEIIALGADSELLLLNAVCAPEQTPFSLLEDHLDEYRQVGQDIRETVCEEYPSLSVRSIVHFGRKPVPTVADAVETYDIGTVVVDQTWVHSGVSAITRSPVEKLAGIVDCNVITPSQVGLPATIESILVTVTAGSHPKAFAEIARSIATASDATVELCLVTSSRTGPPDGVDKDCRTSCDRFGESDEVPTRIVEADNPANAIIEMTHEYDVTVRRAPQKGRLRRLIPGLTSTDGRVAAEDAVLTVWDEQSSPSRFAGRIRRES